MGRQPQADTHPREEVSPLSSPLSYSEKVERALPLTDSESSPPAARMPSQHDQIDTLESSEPTSDKPSWVIGVLDEVEQLLALSFFGICGSIGRNGLVELLRFENLGSVWSNVTACFVIGLIPVLLGPTLSPVVGTGFCGAMSSFSELITDIFTQSTTPLSDWPNYGYGVPLFIARLILEVSTSFTSYTVGGHAALMLRNLGYRSLDKKSELAIRRVCEFFGLAAWVVCLVTTITSENRVRTWPLCGVFAPFGVFCRFYLSKLNTDRQWFKWGTFIANVLATILACVCLLCLKLPSITPLQTQMVRGFQRGFTGCFSTMSTFVKEMNTMRMHHGYFYGIVSIFVGYSLAFVIVGSYIWTR